jgi:hypothetical protein
VLVRVNALNEDKVKKRSTDLVIERSVELFGFTPNEKSDENLKWMRENGYQIKQVQRHRRGSRGRHKRSERQ